MTELKDYYRGGRVMTRKEAASLIDHATAPETMAEIYENAKANKGAREAAEELATAIKKAVTLACEALREDYIPILGITYDDKQLYYKAKQEI